MQSNLYIIYKTHSSPPPIEKEVKYLIFYIIFIEIKQSTDTMVYNIAWPCSHKFTIYNIYKNRLFNITIPSKTSNNNDNL